MYTDSRYAIVKDYFERGKIKEFRQIFIYIPKTVVANDIGTSAKRMTRLIEAPHKFETEEVYIMSELLEIPFDEFLMFTMKDFLREKGASPNKIKRAEY